MEQWNLCEESPCMDHTLHTIVDQVFVSRVPTKTERNSQTEVLSYKELLWQNSLMSRMFKTKTKNRRFQ